MSHSITFAIIDFIHVNAVERGILLMENQKHFCTCADLNCKLNPCNHSRGCDPCIKKNLNAREIPSCFFKLVNNDLSNLKEFTIESFVDFFIKNKNNCSK